MAGFDDYNLQLDSNFTQQEYAIPIASNFVNITGTSTGGAVTNITGDAGAGAVGPIVTLSAGATGYGFTAVGTSVTMTVTSAATVRSSISVPLIHTAAVAPAVTDDGAAGYPIGSLWVDTVLQNAFISVDASTGSAVWKQIT